MKTVRAKVQVGALIPHQDGSKTVHMYGVYSNDPKSENKAFSDATPGINFSLHIAHGKEAVQLFEQGQEYFVDISKAVTPA